MAERKSISKGKRFDIFRRDGFTCQYCGKQPPDVVLEVDHIRPVSKGGDNDDMNLVTACYDCNRGKAAKLLDRQPKPDADLKWLELQQELAELKRYQAAREAREKALTDTVHCLQDTWLNIYPEWHPADHVVRRMLVRHSPELIEETFRVVAEKVGGGYLGKYNNEWLRYAWGVLRNMKQETME